MDWQVWQAVAEIVGAVAVVVSLLYLAAQVRHNTRSVQAAANQELLNTYQNTIDFASQSPFGARLLQGVLSGDWEGFSPEEQTVGRQVWVGICRMFEHAHLQNRAGLLPDQTWRGWEKQLALSSALPGFKLAWPGCRMMLNPEFVTYVEGLEERGAQAAADYVAALAEGGHRVSTIGTEG